MSDPNYEKARTEAFDVVLIKRTANEMAAVPEDFKRVEVEATDPLAAQYDAKLTQHLTDYRILWATKPGYQTDPERQAQARAYNGKVSDPTKIGF